MTVSPSWTMKNSTNTAVTIDAKRWGQKLIASSATSAPTIPTRLIATTHVYPAPRSANALGIENSVVTMKATTRTRRAPPRISGSPG